VADKLADALDQIGELKAELEKLHRSEWEPPKLSGGQALPIVAGTQVWIAPLHRAEYAEVFDAKDLDERLFVDKVVGGKMVVRIGDAKNPKTRFFVAKSHITTTKP
jgi:hypothetical protein